MYAPLATQAMHRPLPPAVIDQLKALFNERFSTADAVREHHGRDESPYAPLPPDAVVFARSTDEVAALVRLAAAR
jgi:D-lactate dehydrogenase (cytochrome)